MSRSYLYRGRIIDVRQDRIKDSSGKVAFREIVEHPGAVAILAIDDQGRVILFEQFRQPANRVLIEIPAGKLEPGESPLDCARRELIEETGFAAGELQEISSYFPSPGFCNEVIYFFKASNLTLSTDDYFDPEENINLKIFSLNDCFKMINDGVIVDGKTIIAIQWALINNY